MAKGHSALRTTQSNTASGEPILIQITQNTQGSKLGTHSRFYQALGPYRKENVVILYLDIGQTKIGRPPLMQNAWTSMPACKYKIRLFPPLPVQSSAAHYLKLIQKVKKSAVSSGPHRSVVDIGLTQRWSAL